MKRLYRNPDWIRERYLTDGWSQNEIASFCGVSSGTIFKAMKDFGINARTISEANSGVKNGFYIDTPYREYGYLYDAYCERKLSLREIAKESGTSLRTIARWLGDAKIQTRNSYEAYNNVNRYGSNNPNWSGKSICPICAGQKVTSSEKCQTCYFDFLKNNPENNPNYSGILDINSSLRSYSQSTWTQKVFERDAFTCCSCGDSSGGNLNAHHIVPFHIIRDQIIIENFNLNLNIDEDRKSLIQIGKDDSRLNDVDNGITLCEECHKAEHRRVNSKIEDSVYLYSCSVVSVQDADTITVDINLGFGIIKREIIRLFGINSFELTSKDLKEKALALKAKDLISTLCVPGRELIIRTYKAEKYGRWLATIILDVQELNSRLIDLNLAQPYFGEEI